jgi:outer membrane protein assembly factor BamB
MRTANRTAGVLVTCVTLLGAAGAGAQDWPQWRGANRDGKATGFTAPKTWPKELTKKWSEKVGDGAGTPALVGDKLYVFTRQGSQEVLSCRNAADGKEVWQDKYDAAGFQGRGDTGFPGPRSSPTVADGKVVTLGVMGVLSCYDAATGKKLWRKDDLKGWPMFHTASSPIVVNGLCIAQLGGDRNGATVAYDLATGEQKWKADSDSPGYASPVLLKVGDTKAVVAETDKSIIAVNVADGKQLWKTSYPVGRMEYNASTPIVEGDTLVYGGSNRGTKAVKMEKKDNEVTAKELWSNKDNSVQFNSPVLKNGLIYGLSNSDKLFCINAESGKTLWSAPIGASGGGGGGGRGGRGGMGGRGGYGSIVDAGTVLLALTPAGQLVVFEPSDKEFKQVAKYKVADGGTYAYPIVSGSRIFVKDKDSLTLWTIE